MTTLARRVAMAFIALVVTSACGNPVEPSPEPIHTGPPRIEIDSSSIVPAPGSTLVVGDKIRVSSRVEARPPFDYVWIVYREEGAPHLSSCGGGGMDGDVIDFEYSVSPSLYSWAHGRPISLELVYSSDGGPKCFGYAGDSSAINTLTAKATHIQIATWNLAPPQ